MCCSVFSRCSASCVAVCCSVSQRVAVCHSVLQCVQQAQRLVSHLDDAVCCSALQCVAVCGNVLQCGAVREPRWCIYECALYSTLVHRHSATHCYIQRHTVTRNTTQHHTAPLKFADEVTYMHSHTAPHCNTLQHTGYTYAFTNCFTLDHTATHSTPQMRGVGYSYASRPFLCNFFHIVSPQSQLASKFTSQNDCCEHVRLLICINALPVYVFSHYQLSESACF